MTQKKIKINKKELHNFFITLWDKRCNHNEFGEEFVKCYESGKILSSSKYKYLTTIYHHVLPKEKYPELAFEEENIVIIDPVIHEQTHLDIKKTPKIFQKKIDLLKKFGNIKCKD
jgi:hypothetical protein